MIPRIDVSVIGEGNGLMPGVSKFFLCDGGVESRPTKKVCTRICIKIIGRFRGIVKEKIVIEVEDAFGHRSVHVFQRR